MRILVDQDTIAWLRSFKGTQRNTENQKMRQVMRIMWSAEEMTRDWLRIVEAENLRNSLVQELFT